MAEIKEGEASDSKKRAVSLIKSGIVFLSLVGITLLVLFRNQDWPAIIKSLSMTKGQYLIIAFFCMCIFTFAEGCNIRRGLRLFGCETSYIRGIKYAIVGFFFSSITPSATGGQPMQLYYMHKDCYSMAHSSLALLLELISYQMVTIIYAFVGFAVKWEFLSNTVGNIKYLFAVGVLLNLALLLLIGIAIFSKTLIFKLVQGVLKIVKLLSPKHLSAWEQKAHEMVGEYQSSAIYIKENKMFMLRMLFTTLVQITALHSIPFWIYHSFGLAQYGFWDIVLLQAVMFIAVSALPLPGTVGVSESGFMILFKTLFPGIYLSSGMLLSRGISFYLFVAVTGLSLAIISLRNKWKRTA